MSGENRKPLTGRVALVTGATSGIGRAIAERFALEGAEVAINGRSSQRGHEVVSTITSRGGTATFLPADITKVAECRQVVSDTVDRFGRLDILVNCAGILVQAPTPDVTEEEFDRAVTINVKSVYFCGQAALAHMRERGSGRVINLASIAGLAGFADASIYTLTKGAIVTLTKSWAVEFAPYGITVNAIAPGNVETPMNAAQMARPEYKTAMLAGTPLGRNGQVGDIVPAALLLASDEGAYFCGSILVIDGGWIAR